MDVDLSYEIDHKQAKFISKEKSLILKAGFEGSKWKLKFDGTQRKNLIDPYSSREYLKNETMLNYKQSVGVQYIDFSENEYKKLDVEVALPEGLGRFHGMPSFIKVDGFYSRAHTLIADKLKAAFTI